MCLNQIWMKLFLSNDWKKISIDFFNCWKFPKLILNYSRDFGGVALVEKCEKSWNVTHRPQQLMKLNTKNHHQYLLSNNPTTTFNYSLCSKSLPSWFSSRSSTFISSFRPLWWESFCMDSGTFTWAPRGTSKELKASPDRPSTLTPTPRSKVWAQSELSKRKPRWNQTSTTIWITTRP